jgi:hypothetical protein
MICEFQKKNPGKVLHTLHIIRVVGVDISPRMGELYKRT